MKKKIILLTALITLLICNTIGNAVVINDAETETDDEDSADITMAMKITAHKNGDYRIIKAEIESFEVNSLTIEGRKLTIDYTIEFDIGDGMGYSPRMSVQWQYYFTLKSRSMGHADLKVSSSVDHNRHDSITDTIELQINKGDKSAVFEAAVLIDRYIEEEYNASSGKWETIYQNGTNWGDMKYRLFTFNTEKTKMINYPQTLLSKFPMLAKLIESPVFAQLLKH